MSKNHFCEKGPFSKWDFGDRLRGFRTKMSSYRTFVIWCQRCPYWFGYLDISLIKTLIHHLYLKRSYITFILQRFNTVIFTVTCFGLPVLEENWKESGTGLFLVFNGQNNVKKEAPIIRKKSSIVNINGIW